MTFWKYIGALLALGIFTKAPANIAQASDFNVRPGNYYLGDITYTSPEMEKERRAKSLKVSQRGDLIAIFDNELKIQYRLDLANPGEQDFPKNYISFVNSYSKFGSLGKMVKRVKIENIRSTSDSISGTVTFYLAFNSSFGDLNTSIQFDVESKVEPGKVFVVGQGNIGTAEINKIRTKTGSNMKLSHLETSLGSNWDRGIGLIMDFILRIAEPSLTYETVISEVR